MKLARLADVVGLDDVGVVEFRGRAPFLVEAVDEVDVAVVLLGKDLDRNHAVEADLPGEVDAGHGAGAEFALDRVAGNLLGGLLGLDLAPQAVELPRGDDVVLEEEFGEGGFAGVWTLALDLEAVSDFLRSGQSLLDDDPPEQRVDVR